MYKRVWSRWSWIVGCDLLMLMLLASLAGSHELTLEFPLWDAGRFFVLRLETRRLALSDFTSCIHIYTTFASQHHMLADVSRTTKSWASS
jgi:hypothetical protein